MPSIGFMIYSIFPANAKNSAGILTNSTYKMILVNADGTISVKLSDEQLNKIITKNEEVTINIKLSEK